MNQPTNEFWIIFLWCLMLWMGMFFLCKETEDFRTFHNCWPLGFFQPPWIFEGTRVFLHRICCHMSTYFIQIRFLSGFPKFHQLPSTSINFPSHLPGGMQLWTCSRALRIARPRASPKKATTFIDFWSVEPLERMKIMAVLFGETSMVLAMFSYV